MPSFIHARSSRHQRGVAAIEFALIAIIMIVLLLGMLVFWRTFQTQQSLNRAAGDGARRALTQITNGVDPCKSSTGGQNQTLIQSNVLTIIQQQIKQAGLDDANVSVLNPMWDCPRSMASNGSFSFDVKYALPPLLQTSQNWVTEPDNLQIKERIVVHFPPAT